jgi:hypothetical protein
MDPVQQNEVVVGQQLTQAAVMRLAVGEMEVAQDGHLLHRPSFGRVGGDCGDACRVCVRAGDFDLDAGLR